MATKRNHKPTGHEEQWFGYKPVDPKQKAGMVKDVFNSVAGKYDIMNDAMSLGIHRLWKRRFVAEITSRPGQKMLDVAGGTGDISFLAKKKCHDLDVTICDINEEMLKVGRNRAVDKGFLPSASFPRRRESIENSDKHRMDSRLHGSDGCSLNFITGNAESLPFASNTFDIYTISFGLRNVTHISKAISEAYRVLKPGGRMLILEFSEVNIPILDKIYDAFSFHVIPRIGEIIADDRESYQYLVESIRQFPNQQELSKRMKDCGFSRVSYTNLTGGIAAIHRGWKI